VDSTDAKPAFTFKVFATTGQQQHFMEAFEGFDAEWESQGYQGLSGAAAHRRLLGRPSVPEKWKTEGPINFAFGPPHFYQFIEFLREPATTAVIEVFLGGILHAVLLRFRKVFADHEDEKKNIALPIKFCPSLWFGHEEVLVTIVADIETPADYKVAEVLIPEGFKRAATWIQRHGVTHPYLTYYIRDARLDVKPTLSLRPLEETTGS
jgi:hypothetical protein